MLDTPLVTVFCQTYNQESYIRDALEGFVSQKCGFPFEVLVHDDASTDSTPAIIREYEQRYPNIIRGVYQTENQFSKGVNITKAHLYPLARVPIWLYAKAMISGPIRSSSKNKSMPSGSTQELCFAALPL